MGVLLKCWLSRWQRRTTSPGRRSSPSFPRTRGEALSENAEWELYGCDLQLSIKTGFCFGVTPLCSGSNPEAVAEVSRANEHFFAGVDGYRRDCHRCG